MTQLITTLSNAFSVLRSRLHREEGASAVEYGMLVALIAAVVVGIIVLLGPLVAGGFDAVLDALTGAGITPPD
jgi:pilus assembly protein Flp/PilA